MAERQFVVFVLGSERYGIDIQHVSSISEYIEVTTVPDAKPLIQGVINLRGEIIPVINLKRRFCFSDSPVNADTRIIIYKSGKNLIGFLADEASQVIQLQDEVIEPTPEIIGGSNRECIAGIGKLEGRIIILLDLNRLTDEFASLLIKDQPVAEAHV